MKFFSREGKYLFITPWRSGVVVIVYANGTEDRGFKSRQQRFIQQFLAFPVC
jgi:hypothetical protein